MRKSWGYRPVWTDLENFQQQIGNIVNAVSQAAREDVTCTEYPIMDVYEKNGEIYVVAELPGLVQENVNLQFEENVLTISGKVDKTAETGLTAVREERFNGPFKRSIRTSYPVDLEHIKAEMKNGILTIYLPKHQAAKPKTINIKVE